MELKEIKKAFREVLDYNEGFRELNRYEFRCSEVWHCLRRHWLEKNHPKTAVEPDSIGKNKFMLGNAIHLWVQTVLHDEGIMGDIEIEADVYRLFEYDQAPLKIEVSGHVDILYPNGLIELKSASKWAFKRRVDEGKAQKHHIYQANWMAWLLELPEFYIVYINKEADSKIPETFLIFKFETDSIMARNSLERLFHVAKCLDIEKPEDVKLALPHTKFTWECGYCGMRDKCKELGLRPSKKESASI